MRPQAFRLGENGRYTAFVAWIEGDPTGNPRGERIRGAMAPDALQPTVRASRSERAEPAGP